MDVLWTVLCEHNLENLKVLLVESVGGTFYMKKRGMKKKESIYGRIMNNDENEPVGDWKNISLIFFILENFNYKCIKKTVMVLKFEVLIFIVDERSFVRVFLKQL